MKASDVQAFFENLDANQSKLVADLCNGDFIIDPYNVEDQFPGTQKWVRQCYNLPQQHDLIMSALNDVIGGFGVECIRDNEQNVLADYVNTGDTYSPTVVYDTETEEYSLTTWGDWYENWENEQHQENDTITCGWCSYHTPKNYDETAGESWSDVICENCGNYVDGKPGPNNKRNGYPASK